LSVVNEQVQNIEKTKASITEVASVSATANATIQVAKSDVCVVVTSPLAFGLN